MMRHRSRRTKRRNHQYTVCQGGTLLGSMRQPRPVRAKSRIALITSRNSMLRCRPCLASRGNSGSMTARSASLTPIGHQ
ncbi:hypothetical protein J2852_005055 [Azospirillum soli]|nr:hypothetical protein [Azospirillum soli]